MPIQAIFVASVYGSVDGVAVAVIGSDSPVKPAIQIYTVYGSKLWLWRKGRPHQAGVRTERNPTPRKCYKRPTAYEMTFIKRREGHKTAPVSGATQSTG